MLPPRPCGALLAVPPPQEVQAASRVLRLRALQAQHMELRAGLAQAQARVRRLTVHDVLQLHCYLERHLTEPTLAVRVQEAIVRLIEGLCRVCDVEITASGVEPLLEAVRILLRDAEGLSARLCNKPQMCSAEAVGLAPFLLPTTQYRPVREREVNVCYEALHAWLSAFYFVSSAADEMAEVAEDLERRFQECLSCRLGGRASPARSTSEASLHTMDRQDALEPARRHQLGASSEGVLPKVVRGGVLPKPPALSPIRAQSDKALLRLLLDTKEGRCPSTCAAPGKAPHVALPIARRARGPTSAAGGETPSLRPVQLRGDRQEKRAAPPRVTSKLDPLRRPAPALVEPLQRRTSAPPEAPLRDWRRHASWAAPAPAPPLTRETIAARPP